MVFWLNNSIEWRRCSGNIAVRVASIRMNSGMVSACRANRARS